jgi:hypothetical protein
VLVLEFRPKGRKAEQSLYSWAKWEIKAPFERFAFFVVTGMPAGTGDAFVGWQEHVFFAFGATVQN